MTLSKAKILQLEDAIVLRDSWKNESVVFTNGCFDIIHLGHVDYLEKAKALGTKLIVALNTSESVSKIKGPLRPVNNDEARSRVMAAFEFVDMVVFFDEETPLELIKKLVPDILVKGNDYNEIEDDPSSKKYIVGKDVVINNGGKVSTIPLVSGYSTTNTIDRLKS